MVYTSALVPGTDNVYRMAYGVFKIVQHPSVLVCSTTTYRVRLYLQPVVPDSDLHDRRASTGWSPSTRARHLQGQKASCLLSSYSRAIQFTGGGEVDIGTELLLVVSGVPSLTSVGLGFGYIDITAYGFVSCKMVRSPAAGVSVPGRSAGLDSSTDV